MKECDNSKIRISSNFILSTCFLIMQGTLLLRPSLHCNTSLHFTTLHPTTLHYTYRHFTSSHLHFTTLSFGGAGYRSQYSDWPRAGRSEDRIPVGVEIFRTCPDRPQGPPSLLYNGYRVFPGGKERQVRDADPSPSSSAVGQERVELYLYSPYGPYGLYRASVPVQGCTLPSHLP